MADKVYGGGKNPAANAGTPATNPTSDAGRSFNHDQHAGSGPALTASGVTIDGAKIANGESTNLSGGTDNVFDKAVVAKTFDKIIKFRLQYEPMYRQFANVRAIDQAAYPGSKVTLFRTGAKGLPLATAPLSEYADPDALALPGLEDTMDVTVNEYGMSTVVTQRLQRFSWTEINPLQAEYVGRAMRETVDAVYANAIFSSTGGWLGFGARQAVVKAGTPNTIALTAGGNQDAMFNTTGGVTHGLLDGTTLGAGAAGANATGTIDSGIVRRIVGHFRSLGVRPYADGYYVGLITPDAAITLREETEISGWRYPHLDGSWNSSILNGTVGVYEGIRFIEGPQFYGMEKGAKVPDTATTTANLRPATAGTANAIFMGAEGIADVVVEEPHTVVTPTTDKFGRLAGLGFIGCFGATVYDPNAILLVAHKTTK